jgi:hypothetical protein
MQNTAKLEIDFIKATDTMEGNYVSTQFITPEQKQNLI